MPNNNNNQNVTVNPTQESKGSNYQFLGLSASEFKKATVNRKAVSSLGDIPFEKLLRMMEQMSALDEDDCELGGRRLEEWPVIECLKGMVMPAKVSLSGKENEVDYLVHPKKIEKLPLSFSEYKDAIQSLSIGITKQEAKVVSLKDLKVRALLTSVQNPGDPDTGMAYNEDNFVWPVNVPVYKKARCKYTSEEAAAVAIRSALDAYKN